MLIPLVASGVCKLIVEASVRHYLRKRYCSATVLNGLLQFVPKIQRRRMSRNRSTPTSETSEPFNRLLGLLNSQDEMNAWGREERIEWIEWIFHHLEGSIYTKRRGWLSFGWVDVFLGLDWSRSSILKGCNPSPSPLQSHPSDLRSCDPQIPPIVISHRIWIHWFDASDQVSSQAVRSLLFAIQRSRSHHKRSIIPIWSTLINGSHSFPKSTVQSSPFAHEDAA